MPNYQDPYDDDVFGQARRRATRNQLGGALPPGATPPPGYVEPTQPGPTSIDYHPGLPDARHYTPGPDLGTTRPALAPVDPYESLQQTYQTYLGRQGSPQEIQSHMGGPNFNLEDRIRFIQNSPEAQQYAKASKANIETAMGSPGTRTTYGTLPGFESSRLNNPADVSPKYVFGRYASDVTKGGSRPLTGDDVRAFVAQHPDWEIDPNSSPADPRIRIKPGSASLGGKTSVYQDVIRDAGGAGGIQFENAGGAGTALAPSGVPISLPPMPGYGSGGFGGPGGGGGVSALPPGAVAPPGYVEPPGYGTTGATAGGATAGGAVPGGGPGAGDLQSATRSKIMDLLGTDINQASASDKDIAPQVEAYRREQERGAQRIREQTAERLTAQGLGSSGALETQGIVGPTQEAAQQTAGFSAGLVGQKLQQRRGMLQDALRLAVASNDVASQQALVKEMHAIDAQLRQQEIAQQGELGRGALALQGELGRGRLGLETELGRGQLGLGQDVLGYHIGQSEAENRYRMLQLLLGSPGVE